MRDRNSTEMSSVEHAAQERTHKALLEKRRRYNRQYMRSWRADPNHRNHERKNRKRWHYERKVRAARGSYARFMNEHGEPVCGFCRKNPVQTEIVRLQVSENAPHGYVKLRIRYCGTC